MTAMIQNENGKWEDRSIEVLHDALVAHYTKLGLYDHATALKQKCYALSEAGEVTDAVLKNDTEEVKKEIGDVLVTLINWAQFGDFDFMARYEVSCEEYQDYDKTQPALNVCVEMMFNLSMTDKFGESDPCEWTSLCDLFICLMKIAEKYNLTLVDCLGSAYDKVIKRKTKFLNGVLVKESDWHKYPELAES